MTIDLESIASALKREYEDAEDFYTAEIQPEQEAANKYYDAEPFGDETEGRSQIVLPDVAEGIDYMGISVLRLFLSGERVIEIEAVEEEDEDGAEEATAAIHYNFMREQDGARILNDWLQSGLLERIGPIKTVCHTDEKVSRETLVADADMVAAFEMGVIQLGEGEEIEDVAENEDGTFSVTVKRTKMRKQFRDVPIPLEEFRFSRNAKHEDDADYLAHVSLKTRSELVEMGFDREQVDELPLADTLDIVENRYDENQMWRDTSELPHELQTVLLCEEYARMDVDDDGIAEHIKVFRVGSDILKDAETGKPSIETVTEHPFGVFCPFPRAHRLVGNSLADKIMDLQRIRSVIARQMQDGMYLANMPRPLVDMSNSDYAATTIEDVLRPVPGSPIRYKGQAPQPFQAGLDVSKSLAVLEHWNGERETRTGITRLNQGLDADTLNKTATGAALMSAQGQQMEEAVARNFGEAFGRLMAKKLRLMRAEGAQFPIKVDGEYKQANAANWPEEFRLIIRVGLGTGRKEQKLQYLFALGNTMAQGFEVGMVTKRGLFRYGSELVSAMQLGQGDDYFEKPPEDGEPEQEQPDPEMMQAQADIQARQEELALKREEAQFNADLKAFEAERRMALEAAKAEGQLDLAAFKTETEAALARFKTQFEMQNKANLTNQRMGGSLAS